MDTETQNLEWRDRISRQYPFDGISIYIGRSRLGVKGGYWGLDLSGAINHKCGVGVL